MERILPFTSEHEMFRKSLRSFLAKEIVPRYADWEKTALSIGMLTGRWGSRAFCAPG